MAITATSRRLIDLAFAAVLIACVVMFCSRDRIPAMPAGLCEDTDGVPQLPAHASIAAVFARIEGPEDVTGWSIRTLEAELIAQRFRETSAHVFERDDATVEIFALPDQADVVERVLNRELARRDVVYYNGHHFRGALELHAQGHPIAILDTCYSTQFYAALADESELIGNRERAITGSVYGFADLLAALLHRDNQSWKQVLAPVNAAAIRRASLRDVYPEPERYGRVGYCGQAPADEP